MANSAQRASDQRRLVDLHIKRPYYGAFREFGWKQKDWGYGVALSKLQKLENTGKTTLTIQLEKPDTFEVELVKLKRRIQLRNSYNVNGKERCGYLTKSDIYELARRHKNGVAEVEHTNRAED